MQTARTLRLAPVASRRSRTTQLLSIFLILWVAFPSSLLAQSGTVDGTYHFGSLAGDNSGGSGFENQGDKFVVSNIFKQDVSPNTRMYADNNTGGAAQTVILKANNTLIKTFTLKDIGISNFGTTTFPLAQFDITLYDYFGNVIATHSLAGNQSFTNAGPSIASFNFTTAWPAAGYTLVNSVSITFRYSGATIKPSNMNWNNWSLASMSNTVPSSTTVGTLSGTSFCAGSAISIPFTATGYNSGNTYTAQLSNSAGLFTSPTSLGTLAGNAASGTISGTIPSNTSSGTGYRIRIIGSNPATSPATNPDNGTNLTVNPLPSANISAFSNISCFGGSNGSVTVTASGGTAGYNYSWSPSGGTGATASNLTQGTYTATVTDSKGCTATASKTLTQPSSAVSGSTVVTNVSCFGGSNGAIDLTPSGGTAGYTYNWGGGITTQDRTGLQQGTYSVIITDANGCTATVSNIQVTQPTAAVSGTTVVTNVSCFGGSNGAINLTPTGGTAGGYTFNWGGGITTEDRTGLIAGNYSVIITDINGCSGIVSNIQVTQPTAAVSGTTVVTNVACFGGNTGAINLTPTGGTAGGYTYNWGGGITTEDRTGLAAGNYSVIITDVNGCTGTVSNIAVTQPTAPVSGTTVVTNVSCFGGTNGAINLTPTGGTAGGYTYNWGGGITTEDRTGLAAGNYSVIITDVNGCTGTVSNIAVTQPTAPVSGTTVVTNVSCFGGTNGAINLTPTGGTAGGYTYNWGGGITTEDRTGLAAGNYSVIITDVNGCTGTVSNIAVTQPTAPVSGTTVVTNVSCFGGTNGAINLTPTGGTAGGYTYNWGGGITTEDRTGLAAGNYSVIITDVNGCTGTVSNIAVTQPTAPVSGTTVVTNVSCFGGTNGAINLTPTGGTAGGYTFNWGGGITTEDRTGLAAGNYSVIITDINGCTGTVSGIQVTQPSAPVSGTTVVTNVACFGGNTGAINLTPTGGTAGGYTFNWGGGITTEDRTNLAAGSYSVTITDINGCTGTVSGIQVTQPSAPVSGTTSVTDVSCFGGSNGAINLTPTGGTAGFYTFNWGGGITTEDRTNLAAGSYSVTITDINGCTGTVSGIQVTQPSAPVSGTTSVTDVSCFGGSNGAVNLTPAGGTAPYTFDWGGGITTEDRTGLTAGTYSVIITDNNGCQQTVSNITVSEPAQPAASISYANSPYFTGSGSATVTFSGTTGGTYSAAPAGMSIDAATGTIDLAASTPGTYTVTYTIANATCGDYMTTASVTLVNPFSATISYDGSPYCTSTGTASVTRTGTTGGTYSATPAGLSLNASTGDIDLAASTPGTYTVKYGTTPTDFTTTQVSVRPTTFVNSLPNTVLCNGATYGPVTFTGAAGLTFNWTSSNPAIGIAASGTNMIPAFTATNNGTTASQSYVFVEPVGGTGCNLRNMTFRITVNPTPVISAVPDQTLCAGTNTSAVNFVSSVGGTTISWTNNNTAIGLHASGTGNIPAFNALNNTGVLQTSTITTTAVADGCTSAPTSFTIAVSPSAGTINYPGSPYCQIGPAVPTRTGSQGGVFTSTAGLDINPATGSVNLGASTPGTYTVTYTVAASGGCSATATANLTINPQAFVNTIGNQVYCNGIVTTPVPFTGNAASYSWTNTDPSIGLAASGTGTSLPSYTTVNAGPALRYAYIRVTPQGNGSTACPGRGVSFRITVNYCGPIAGLGDTGGNGNNLRTAIQQSFQAGPNPATGSVVLQYTGAEQGPFTVQLVSQYGTPMGKTATMSGTTYTMDLSNVTPGSYLLKVTHVKTGISFNKQVIKL